MSGPYTEGWPKEMNTGLGGSAEAPQEATVQVVPLSDAERMREALEFALASGIWTETCEKKARAALNPEKR